MATRRLKARNHGGSIFANLLAYTAVNAALAPGQGSMTFSTWVRISAQSYSEASTHEIGGYRSDLYATTGWLLSQYAANLYFYQGNGGAPPLGVSMPRSSVVDKWSHIVVVLDADAGTGTIYLNGEVLLAPTAMSWNASATGSPATFEVGAGNFPGMTDSRISRTCYWVGTALTAAEVASLYYDGVEPGSPVAVFNAESTLTTTTRNDGSIGGNFTTNAAGWWSSTTPFIKRRSRQNLFTYGNDLSNASWTKLRTTVAVSPLTHPTRPGADVWRVSTTAVTNSFAIQHLSYTPILSTPARITFKARGGGGCNLAFDPGTYFNFTTGAFTATSGTVQARSLGDGWFEFSYEATSMGQVYYYLTAPPATLSYAGTGAEYIDFCDFAQMTIDRPYDYIDTTDYIVYYGEPSQEESRQNYIESSNTISTWTAVGGVVVAANGDSWDVTDNNAAAYAYVVPSTVTTTPGKIYALQFLIAKTTVAASGVGVNLTMAGDLVALRMNTNSGVILDLSTASLGTKAYSKSVSVDGVDYWQVVVTFMCTASAAVIYLYPAVCALSGRDLGSDSTARTGSVTVRGFALTRSLGFTSRTLNTSPAGAWSTGFNRGEMPAQQYLTYSDTLTNASWIQSANTDVTDNGDGSFTITVNSGGANETLLKYVSAAPFNASAAGYTYTLRFKILKTTGGTQPGFLVYMVGGPTLLLNLDLGTVLYSSLASSVIEDAGDGYWQVSITSRPFGGAIYFYLYPAAALYGSIIYDTVIGGSVQVKEFSFTASDMPADRPVTSGITVPGRGGRSRMMGQNRIIYSSDLSQAGVWTRTNLTSVTDLGAVGPGGVTAFRLTDNVGAGAHMLSQTIATPVAGQVYTYSVVARADTKDALILAPEGAGVYVTFNLSTLASTTGAGTVLRKGIISLGDGWYLCYMTYLSVGASDTRLYMGAASYVADGTGTIDFCMPQITSANGVAPYYATSATAYVPLTGAPRALAV